MMRNAIACSIGHRNYHGNYALCHMRRLLAGPVDVAVTWLNLHVPSNASHSMIACVLQVLQCRVALAGPMVASLAGPRGGPPSRGVIVSERPLRSDMTMITRKPSGGMEDFHSIPPFRYFATY